MKAGMGKVGKGKVAWGKKGREEIGKMEVRGLSSQRADKKTMVCAIEVV